MGIFVEIQGRHPCSSYTQIASVSRPLSLIMEVISAEDTDWLVGTADKCKSVPLLLAAVALDRSSLGRG